MILLILKVLNSREASEHAITARIPSTSLLAMLAKPFVSILANMFLSVSCFSRPADYYVSKCRLMGDLVLKKFCGTAVVDMSDCLI